MADSAGNIRQSNMELLRIVAMFLVLVVHADFYALGTPTALDAQTAPLSTFLRFFTESLSIVSVNVFVLISGWFGIRPGIRGAGNFLFQCFFYKFAILALFLAFGSATLCPREIAECFYMTRWDWFVKAYLGLYILSPVLNAFVEKATARQMAYTVGAFFLFQTVYAWISVAALDFRNGYSTLSFIGLYLLARYVRIHPPGFLRRLRGGGNFAGYLAVALLGAALAFRFNDATGSRLYFYSAPNVILGALLLLLSFTRLKFRSRAINWIAASCFAVYLIHTDPHVTGYYKQLIGYLYDRYTTVPFIAATFVCLCAIFIGCVLIDKIRLFLWRRLWDFHEKFRRYPASEAK